jgi:hypothetical protein
MVTLCDSCDVRTKSRFHFVVVTLCDSCDVRTESRFHFVVVTLCDSREVRTEFRFHFVVLLSTLLQDILHPSHHLLNVLLQIANKLGLRKKQRLTVGRARSFRLILHCFAVTSTRVELINEAGVISLFYQNGPVSHKY